MDREFGRVFGLREARARWIVTGRYKCYKCDKPDGRAREFERKFRRRLGMADPLEVPDLHAGQSRRRDGCASEWTAKERGGTGFEVADSRSGLGNSRGDSRCAPEVLDQAGDGIEAVRHVQQ